jgi:hypothetical protein
MARADLRDSDSFFANEVESDDERFGYSEALQRFCAVY